MLGLSIGWKRIESLTKALIDRQFMSVEEQPKIMLVSGDGTYWYHWNKEKILSLVKGENGAYLLNANGEKTVRRVSVLEEPSKGLRKIGEYMIAGQSGVDVVEQGTLR